MFAVKIFRMENDCCCSHNLCPLHGNPNKFYGSALKLGCHVPLGDTLLQTLQSCREHCLNTCQIFMGNPMAYNVRSLKKEREALLQYQSENPLHFYVHAPYILNLASDNPNTREKSATCLQGMLKELSGTNSSVVVHTGSRGTLTDIVEKLNSMTIEPGTPAVLLENADGAGTKLGKNFDELRRIAEGVDRSFKLGFCIDTAHIFTAGESDLSTDAKNEEIVDFLSDYQHRLIHLNDSATCFCSHRDNHEGLGCGHIWGQNLNSLQSLLHFSLADDIPIILETPTSLDDLKLASDLL